MYNKKQLILGFLNNDLFLRAGPLETAQFIIYCQRASPRDTGNFIVVKERVSLDTIPLEVCCLVANNNSEKETYDQRAYSRPQNPPPNQPQTSNQTTTLRCPWENDLPTAAYLSISAHHWPDGGSATGLPCSLLQVHQPADLYLRLLGTVQWVIAHTPPRSILSSPPPKFFGNFARDGCSFYLSTSKYNLLQHLLGRGVLGFCGYL